MSVPKLINLEWAPRNQTTLRDLGPALGMLLVVLAGSALGMALLHYGLGLETDRLLRRQSPYTPLCLLFSVVIGFPWLRRLADRMPPHPFVPGEDCPLLEARLDRERSLRLLVRPGQGELTLSGRGLQGWAGLDCTTEVAADGNLLVSAKVPPEMEVVALQAGGKDLVAPLRLK